jgi:hypothetical protein
MPPATRGGIESLASARDLVNATACRGHTRRGIGTRQCSARRALAPAALGVSPRAYLPALTAAPSEGPLRCRSRAYTHRVRWS